MRSPGRRDVRFHRNTYTVETGNKGKRNRKRIRFHSKDSIFIDENKDSRKRNNFWHRKRIAWFGAMFVSVLIIK